MTESSGVYAAASTYHRTIAGLTQQLPVKIKNLLLKFQISLQAGRFLDSSLQHKAVITGRPDAVAHKQI